MAGIFSGLLGNPQERPVPGLLSGQVPPRRNWGQALEILGAGLRDIGDPNGQNLAMLNERMAPQREAQAAAQMAAQQAQERAVRADALGLQGRERDLYIYAPEDYAGLAATNMQAGEISAGNTWRNPVTGETYMAPEFREMGDQLVRTDSGGVAPVFRRDQTYAETETNRANLAGEALTERGQNVTMRGQDIGAETSRYGTDVSAGTAADRLAFDREMAATAAAAARPDPDAARQAIMQSAQYSNAQIEDLEEAIRQAGGREGGGRTVASNIRAFTPIPGAVGFGSGLAALPGGTPAANVRSLLDSVTGTVALERLDNLRQLAAQSGASGSGLGQVTEKEIAILRAARGALDPGMEPGLFLEQANRLLRDLRAVQNERKAIIQRDFPDVYEQIYGGGSGGSGGDQRADPLGLFQ